ncbi:Hypothetical protein ABZS17G119_02360 [Kosakonia cowanii]
MVIVYILAIVLLIAIVFFAFYKHSKVKYSQTLPVSPRKRR